MKYLSKSYYIDPGCSIGSDGRVVNKTGKQFLSSWSLKFIKRAEKRHEQMDGLQSQGIQETYSMGTNTEKWV